MWRFGNNLQTPQDPNQLDRGIELNHDSKIISFLEIFIQIFDCARHLSNSGAGSLEGDEARFGSLDYLVAKLDASECNWRMDVKSYFCEPFSAIYVVHVVSIRYGISVRILPNRLTKEHEKPYDGRAHDSG